MKTRFLIFTQAFTALCFCLLAPSISTDAWTGPRMRKSSVTSGPLSFANLISSIRFGRKWQFQATGGSTPYTFSLAAGTGSVTAGGLFTPPSTSSGSSTVRVTDNASAQVNTVTSLLDPMLAPHLATAISINSLLWEQPIKLIAFQEPWAGRWIYLTTRLQAPERSTAAR